MTKSTKHANEESNCIIDFARIEKVMAIYSQMSSFSDSDSDYDDDESNLSEYEQEQLHIESLRKQTEELKKEILLTEQKKEILYKSVQGLKQMEAMSAK